MCFHYSSRSNPVGEIGFFEAFDLDTAIPELSIPPIPILIVLILPGKFNMILN